MAVKQGQIVNVEDLMNFVYPIGSYFFTDELATGEAVTDYFKNEYGLENTWWESVEESRGLIAAGSTYTVGSEGGEAEHTLSIDEIPSHTHTLTIVTNGYSGGLFGGGGGGEYLHTNLTKTGTTSSSGGSQPHNNMSPYRATYIYKRVSTIPAPVIRVNEITCTIISEYSGSIYYTLDGSDPTTSDTLYNGSFSTEGMGTFDKTIYNWAGTLPGLNGNIKNAPKTINIKAVLVKDSLLSGTSSKKYTYYSTDSTDYPVSYTYAVGDTITLDGVECLIVNAGGTTETNIAVSKNAAIGSSVLDRGYEWGAYRTKINITSQSLGVGLSNSNTALNNSTSFNPNTSSNTTIWTALRDLRAEKSDYWFVPSVEELKLVYNNRSSLNDIYTSGSQAQGNSTWYKYYYWSCSENNLNNNISYTLNFSNGNSTSYSRTSLYSVRFCRVF